MVWKIHFPGTIFYEYFLYRIVYTSYAICIYLSRFVPDPNHEFVSQKYLFAVSVYSEFSKNAYLIQITAVFTALDK